MTGIKETGSIPERCIQHSDNETRALLLQVAPVELEMAGQTRALQLQERQGLPYESELNSLSPIDQIPAEIKIEIFYYVLLNDRANEGERRLVTPFFLGKICRGWRDFVWSSPILWTNLHLCLSKDRYQAQTDLLRGWLSRTAKCPLSFRITTLDPQRAWVSNPPIEVLTMFASISLQWKEVEFFLPDTQDSFNAISAAENSLPLLTTATAHLGSSERQLTLFSTAPQLSVLHLHDPYLFEVLAPWHQLREFTSQACTVDEIHGFLNKAPNIIRCSFRTIVSIILYDWWDEDIFGQLPVLEHLEYLELCFDESLDATSTQILGPVELPSLREVSLFGPFATPPENILPVLMTSFHSSHHLEKFTFGGTITSDHDLIQVLENIPSIKDLFLDFRDQYSRNELLTKELLQRLYPPHTDILLPNLQSFKYDGPTSLNDHVDLFRDVLVYRFRQCALQPTELGAEQRTVCQIQSVALTSSSEVLVGPDIQDELDSLVREGLVLSLTFSRRNS